MMSLESENLDRCFEVVSTAVEKAGQVSDNISCFC